MNSRCLNSLKLRHNFSELKYLTRKYFFLMVMLAILPVTIFASYQQTMLGSQAKGRKKPPSPTPTLTVSPSPTSNPSPTPIEIILDNSDQSGINIQGIWPTSTATGGYYPPSPAPGNYLHDNNSEKGDKSVSFIPNIPLGSYYEVFIRRSAEPNRSVNTPVEITHADGTTTLNVNQTTSGKDANDVWISLGSYYFNQGNSGYVNIKNDSTGYVVADAIRFLQTDSIIIDNADQNRTEKTGSWTKSNFSPGFIGSDYLHDNNEKTAKSVTFTPNIHEEGFYDVYLNWAADTNRDKNIPVLLHHAYGDVTIYINENGQYKNSIDWKLLGRYYFSRGQNGFVKIQNSTTSQFVIADAVQFLLIPDFPPSPTPEHGNAPNPTPQCTQEGNTICARYVETGRDQCDATYFYCNEDGIWEERGTVDSCKADGCSNYQECTPYFDPQDPKCGPENRCKVGELCLEVPPEPPNPYSKYACWQSIADCPLPTNTPVPLPSNTPRPGPSNTPPPGPPPTNTPRPPTPTGNPPPTVTRPVPTNTPGYWGETCSNEYPTSEGCRNQYVGHPCLDPDYYCKMTEGPPKKYCSCTRNY